MTAAKSRAKILIVDDEPFNVDYLEQELEEADYEIITAENGQEALEKVNSKAPDLVLLDIMMPVMDGFEALSHLKSNLATRDIPVIVISASSDLRSVVKGIQLGAEDYLPKPFEPILLHARIASSLEKKRLRDLQQVYLKGLEHELEIGREIQQNFLPSELPQVDGWDIAVYFKAAREVAGDYYDSFLLPGGNLVCVVGDVCGKGVGAALFMALFRTLIRAFLATGRFLEDQGSSTWKTAQRLSQMVAFINQYVAETHGDAGMFSTAFIGVFNLQDGLLTYLNCGNEAPLLLGKDGAITPMRPTGPVVGVFSDAHFGVREIQMGKEDSLLIFTDGIPDATNPDGTNFGHERLRQLLNDPGSPTTLLACIEGELHQFVGTANQFDDITILAIRRTL